MSVRERIGGFRQKLRSTRAGRLLSKVTSAVVGGAVIAVGIVLIPFPGPGWAIVFFGLAILAVEFVWARRLLRYARSILERWWRWIGRQHTFVRVLIGIAGLAFVGGIVLLSLRLSLGPERFSDLLDIVGS
jgi:uncharacterized protein (TIGR02611 family)